MLPSQRRQAVWSALVIASLWIPLVLITLYAFNGATLQGSTATLLAQGAVTNNGTLTFDQASNGIFANAITGSGALIKRNTGTLTLGGVSSAATTEVAGGTLVFHDVTIPDIDRGMQLGWQCSSVFSSQSG